MGWIYGLKENEIFVFGSNEAGIHGAGAAKQALMWGAKPFVGCGLVGKTYALPTKDRNIKTLPLEKIEKYVEGFKKVAKQKPNLKFLVTEVGCGLAGYKPEHIAPFFKDSPSNVILPDNFKI